MQNLRYIQAQQGLFIFDNGMSHVEFAHYCQLDSLHAGFVSLNAEGKFSTYGRSTSLRLGSEAMTIEGPWVVLWKPRDYYADYMITKLNNPAVEHLQKIANNLGYRQWHGDSEYLQVEDKVTGSVWNMEGPYCSEWAPNMVRDILNVDADCVVCPASVPGPQI